jgi:hypothetical protein
MLVQTERSRVGAWHQSKVSTILDCPRRFGLEYVLELPAPESPWTVAGSAFHAALELHEKARMAGEPVPSRDVLYFTACDFIDDHNAMNGNTFSDSTLDDMKSNVDDALYNFWYYKIDDMFTVREYIMQFDPIYIESYFNVDLVPNSLPIAGWIDVVYRREDGSFFIADFKTAKDFSFWNKDTSYINQATFYAAGLSASKEFPEIDEMLPFEFLIMRKSRGKTKQFIGSKIVKCHPTVDDLNNMVERILLADTIVKEDQFPMNTGSKFCNERLCPFFNDCAGGLTKFSEKQLFRNWNTVKQIKEGEVYV